MPYLAVDLDGDELIAEEKPIRKSKIWETILENIDVVYLPKGSIKALIGRELTWTDEPVDLEKELRKD